MDQVQIERYHSKDIDFEEATEPTDNIWDEDYTNN